jgi:catechol 2,3-dioxygenase-like lactoylglutathione lyase family enzyme
MRSTALAARERFDADAVTLRRSSTDVTEPGGDDRVAVAGIDCLSVFTPELRRSVEFYSRVFGFGVVDASRGPVGRSALMAAGRFYLELHERRRSRPDSMRALGWSFVVDDLDRVRASIWDLGIVPLPDGTDERQRNRSSRGSRSFTIRDPGGNEIEVVERGALFASPSSSVRDETAVL